MLIIADRKIPDKAAARLSDYGEIHFFESRDITYDAISGHPDVFLCQVNDTLVAAPNIPDRTMKELQERGIHLAVGESPVGARYPETARYNAVCSGSYLLHNFRYTDSVITDLAGDLDLVHLSQGYSRCNLLPLHDGSFITSDEGVFRVLRNQGMTVLKVTPDGIMLPGFKHGFIGGAAGILEDTVFFVGRLDQFSDGGAIRQFLEEHGQSFVELYEGPLFDIGSLFFLPEASGR
jgi:hypothetical protein